MVTNTMNKVFGNNESAKSKGDLEWMGGEERERVLGWQVLEQRHAGEG